MDNDIMVISHHGEMSNEMVTYILLVYLGIIAVFFVLHIIAKWKIYTKAGEKGWASLIPFYTDYTQYKITWGEGWNFLYEWVTLPLVPVIIQIITSVKLARSFGKSDGFAVGLIFLPTIFLYILAFGKSEYIGPTKKLSDTYVD